MPPGLFQSASGVGREEPSSSPTHPGLEGMNCLEQTFQGLRLLRGSSSSKDSDRQALTDGPVGGSLPREEGAEEPPCGEAAKSWVEDLNEEIVWVVVSFLRGSEAGALRPALSQVWRDCLAKPEWWRSRCGLEYFRGHVLPTEACGLASHWRERYRELSNAQNATAGTWCYRSRSHGLGDRFASPQMFIGPSGRKVFSYGGWYRMQGPRTDLTWVALDAIYRSSVSSPGAGPSSSSAEGPGVAADHTEDVPDVPDAREGAQGTADNREEHKWGFQAAEASGKPAIPAGVQTLTPCWFRSDAPSADFVQATAARLGDPDGGVGASLVVAFGGAQAGYRNESCDWAVGVLHEGAAGAPAKIFWGQPRSRASDHSEAASTTATPTRRGAHSATYVPARLAGMGGAFPEGCVVVFGGHTDDCTRSLSSVDVLDLATWQWHTDFVVGLGRVNETRLRRHGHSATLQEFDSTGYLVVVGGGRGNILREGRNAVHEDKSDAVVLDTRSWSWAGLVNLGRPIDAPAPGRHHTASLGLGDRILLFGGGDQPANRILVLNGELCVRRALKGEHFMELREVIGLSKKLPGARKLHGAVSLLPWAPFLVVNGGWELDVPFMDIWVCALGHTSADLKRFARQQTDHWQLEAMWQSEATVSPNWSDEEFDWMDDDEEDDFAGGALPAHWGGRTGPIRQNLIELARNNNLVPLNTTSRNDMNLMNALALASPTVIRR